MAKSPKSLSVKVGDEVVSASGNTRGIAMQVDTFITKSGESTLRVQVQTDDGGMKWVTLKA